MSEIPWTSSDEQLLRELYGKVPTRQIAERMGRSVSSIKARALRLGLKTRSMITPEQLQAIRDAHGKELARDTAARLGIKVSSVHNSRHRMGLGRGTRVFHGSEFEAFLREKHALGWSDEEIAQAYKPADRPGHRVNRHTVGDWRVRLGLGSNALSEHRRRKVAERTREQLAKIGLTSIGYLRVEAFKKFARDSGWPEDLQVREVQILNAMWNRGPMTRREISDAIGMPWKGSRKSLAGNRKGGGLLATLMRRGMVICLGRVVKHPDAGKGGRAGQGKNTCIYSLSPSIQRRAVNDNQSKEQEVKHGKASRNIHPCQQAAGHPGASIEPSGDSSAPAVA